HFLDGSLKRACAAGCTPIVGEASVVAPDQVANGARDYPPMGRMVDVAGGVLATAHPDLGSRGSVYRYRKHLTVFLRDLATTPAAAKAKPTRTASHHTSA